MSLIARFVLLYIHMFRFMTLCQLVSLIRFSFMESLLPNIEWSDGHFGSFHTVVNRLVKLFRMFCRVVSTHFSYA